MLYTLPPRGVLTLATTLASILLLLLWYRSNITISSISPSPEDSSSRPQKDLLEDVYNSTLGFQKIYVISLASRSDHRDAMSLAAEVSGLDIEYVDGVTTVDTKALPPGNHGDLTLGNLGAWRAHMNAVRLIIEQNIQSALILEGDVDWDIRLKSQMQNFAKASRLLLQPLPPTSEEQTTTESPFFLDPTYPIPNPDQGYDDFSITSNYSVTTPVTSPYSDLTNWDIFWLGHCGARFPDATDENVPLGRAILPDDATVPEKQHLDMQFGDSQLLEFYPAHTRVVSRARMNTCSLAYALSNPGSKRMMYELGVRQFGGPMDMEIRSMCHGSEGRHVAKCLSVQPQIFQHHRPRGNKGVWSDINAEGADAGRNEVAFTRNVRWSVRLNCEKLVNGEMDGFIDQFPDGEEKKDFG